MNFQIEQFSILSYFRTITLCLALFLGGVKNGWGQTLPAAFDLSTGNWTLTGWNNGVSSGSYPSNGATGANTTTGVIAGASNANMVFWRTGTNDPSLSSSESSNYSSVYNGSSGTRMNGQGANGFSFVNTSTSGNLGMAVLGLNTSGRQNIQVSWTARVLSALTYNASSQNRFYNIRLQYKVGSSGSWTDFSSPVEFVSNSSSSAYKANNTAENFGATTLPSACENQSAVYLRWFYYRASGSGGTRPTLGIDEISVTSSAASAIPTVNLSINTSSGSESGATAITLTATTSSAVTGNQTVNIALSGTNLANADFTSVSFPTTITINNGQTTGSLSFSINDDASNEGTETATFTISSPTSGISLGSTTTQNLTITDNDAPAIIAAGSLTSFCTSTGTASAIQTFTVSGDALTGNLTVTPPTGFEVSTDGGATYGTSQSIPVSGGIVVNEPLTIRVRIAASAAEGTLAAANITISGGGATAQTVSASGTVGYATTLAAGDISIIGFNGTGTDRFAFVNWVAIPNLTKITFTDNAWTTASGPLATNENDCVWQNNTGSSIPAGTVIVFVNGSGFDQGTLLSGSLNGIGSGAENIFAYQGPSCNPSFIFGAISGTTSWVSTGTPTNSNSYLPSSLSSANIILGSNGNGQYTGSRSNQTTIAAYKPIVNNITNWTTSSTEVNPVNSTDFSTSITPTVNLSLSSNSGNEAGAPSITATVTASSAVVGVQTVTISVSGTNITGADYSLSSSTITILNGQTTGTATFQILDDSNNEGSETAVLTISAPSSGIVLGSTTTQNLTITDNDAPAIIAAGSLTSFCTSSGTASAVQTFTVSGDALTGNLTVTPPTGFEVSTDGGATYGTSQSIPVSGGIVVNEPLTIRVRIAASAAEGTLAAANITISGGGATAQTVSASGTVGYATTLAAGDISIIGFNGTGTDRFAFVNWVAIPNLTKITFTDNAWTTASGPLATNENDCVWQNNTGSSIPAGTVIVFVNGSGFDQGTLLSGSLNGIGSGAENIFAYQGPSCNPSFIFGAISGTTSWVSTGTPTNSNSYLPSSLSSANIILGSNGNGQYTSSRANQTTIADYKPIVNNISNWTTSTTEVNPVNSTDFTTSTNPEVNLSVSANAGTETGAPTITVTLTSSLPVSGNQSVTISVSGTNITGTDYSLSSSTITILSGQTTGTVTFQILDDSNVESSETAILTISSPTSGIVLGSTLIQNIVISDNENQTFYSQGSGVAATGAIWDIVPSGTGQLISSFGGFSQSANVVIQSGHTVDFASNADMKDLTINSGGTLRRNSTNSSSMAYLNIYGSSITINGSIGTGSTFDAIGLSIEGSSVTLSGSGNINIGRIRKNTSSTSSFITNSNINLLFPGTCIFSSFSGTSVFNFTIPTGKTVTVSNGSVSIDGSNGAGIGERSGTFTINGTLNISDTLIVVSDNSSGVCTYTINSGGIVNAGIVKTAISATSVLNVNSGSQLNISKSLQLKSGTFSPSGNVTLLSTATGTAYLDNFSTGNSGLFGTSSFLTVQRYLGGSTVYHYLSSPVDNAFISDWADDFTVTGQDGFLNTGTAFTNPWPTVWYYDESNTNANMSVGWTSYTSTSSPFSRMTGYACLAGGTTIDVTGTVNQTPTLTKGITKTTSSQPLSDGWNLLGNPYPCTIDWDAVYGLNSSNVSSFVYYWSASANNYATYNNLAPGATTNGGSDKIPSSQAFFIRKTTTGNASFFLNSTVKATDYNPTFFKEEENNLALIKLEVSKDGFSDELAIYQADWAENGIDENADILEMASPVQKVPSFFTILGLDKLSNNGFNQFKAGQIIPLGISNTQGIHKLKVNALENMELPVYLEDRKFGTFTVLNPQKELDLAVAESDGLEGRFFLRLGQIETNITSNTALQVAFLPSDENIRMEIVGNKSSQAELAVADANGRIWSHSTKAIQQGQITETLNELSQGIYVLNLRIDGQNFHFKFVR